MRSSATLSVLLSATLLAGCLTTQMPAKPPRPTLTISDDGCMAPADWARLMHYVTALEHGYE